MSALACAPASPDRGISQGDGTARATFDAHSDGAEPFTVEIQFPADSSGAPSGTSLAGAVILPAADEDPSQYRWLAHALALQGFVVALPEFPHGQPDLDPNRANVSRDLLMSSRGLLANLVSARVGIIGHALGGQVAASQAIGGPFNALVLLGAAPRPDDPVEKLNQPSLLVAGTSDCAVPDDETRSGWARLPPPTFLAELSGVTSLQFIDDDAQDLADCPPGVGLDAAHARVTAVVADFLSAMLRGDADGVRRLESPQVGVVVQSR